MIPPIAVFRSCNPEILRKWYHKHRESLLQSPEVLLNEEYRSKIREALNQYGYVHIPGMFSSVFTSGLREVRNKFPSKKVYESNDPGQNWTQYSVEDHMDIVAPIIESGAFGEFVESVWGSSVRDTNVWINHYRRGEYIPEHCDAAGSFQLLIGLSMPEVESPQGAITIDGRNIVVNEGDLLLFYAHRVKHGTVPITEEKKVDRMNVVIRLYE